MCIIVINLILKFSLVRGGSLVFSNIGILSWPQRNVCGGKNETRLLFGQEDVTQEVQKNGASVLFYRIDRLLRSTNKLHLILSSSYLHYVQDMQEWRNSISRSCSIMVRMWNLGGGIHHKYYFGFSMLFIYFVFKCLRIVLYNSSFRNFNIYVDWVANEAIWKL